MKEQFGSMHFSKVFADIHKITESLSSLVENEETQNLSKELNKTLLAVQKMVAGIDGRIGPASDNLASIATSARLSMKNANKLIISLSEAIVPLMNETTVAVGRVGGALDERSTLRVEFEELLESLTKAAKSFSELTSYIEQHPESLLRGKE